MDIICIMLSSRPFSVVYHFRCVLHCIVLSMSNSIDIHEYEKYRQECRGTWTHCELHVKVGVHSHLRLKIIHDAWGRNLDARGGGSSKHANTPPTMGPTHPTKTLDSMWWGYYHQQSLQNRCVSHKLIHRSHLRFSISRIHKWSCREPIHLILN